ncbi:protein hinderin-like [Glandiceps talaboti]
MSEDLTYEIYWTKDSSDDEDLPLVQVPGVNDVGNKRPSVKMRARRTKEIKAVVPPKSPVIVEDLSPNKRKPLKSINKSNDDAETVEFSKENNMNSRQRPALKDLRPEDKKRVANLIRELARIGEEKENAVEQLHLERFSFEERTQKLQDQYDSILKEREDILFII